MALDESLTTPGLLTATQVQALFGVDRSTVYRMADDGRLPGVKVGKQWRFHRATIETILHPSAGTAPAIAATMTTEPVHTDAPRAELQYAANVAAELLGVMVMITDMDGQPLTEAANPCQRFANADAEDLAACAAEWKGFADEVDLTPRFRVGPLGFECARVFVRSGTSLTAMVLVGGIAAPGDNSTDLHVLDVRHRADVLTKLPRIAAALAPLRPPAAHEPVQRSGQ